MSSVILQLVMSDTTSRKVKHMSPQTRRKKAKGDWAQLRDPDLLERWMKEKDMSQARLARYAECSRQFINQLVKGERNSCTPFIAERIEEGLAVVEGTIFDHKKSSQTVQKQSVTRRAA